MGYQSDARESGQAIRYEYREIRSADNLLALLRLRYEVFSSSRTAGLVEANNDRIDCDPFDRVSRHFGYFRIQAGQSELLGGIRVVMSDHTADDTLLRSLVTVSEQVARSYDAAIPASLPILTYAPDRTHLKKVLAHQFGDQTIVEGSRLCLARTVSSRRHGRHIAASAVATMLHSRCAVAGSVIGCAASQRHFYGAYGFEPIDGCAATVWDKPAIPAVCLVATAGSAPAPHLGELERLAAEYDRSGRCTLVPRASQASSSKSFLCV